MKYGVAVQQYGKYALYMDGMNVGDPIQSIAVENLYKHMGIPESEIVRIPMPELKSYSGEYVVMPMSGVATGTWFPSMPLSPKIIPVFISLYIPKTELTDKEVEYLRFYSPIGCRDELVLETMRKYGIPAYLSGCLSAAVFDKRNFVPDKPKAFFIDAPERLEEYIPERIRNNMERISHIIPMPKREITKEEADSLYNKCRDILTRYKNEATLVVSSRLHGILPCMAMGIPVIAAFENISYRFSWLDKYIKLYSPGSFSKINWEPSPVDYEDNKKWLLEFFCEQVRKTYDRFSPYYSISDFYENRERSEYGSFYYEKVRSMRSYMPEKFKYIIWGCAVNSCCYWLLYISCLQNNN